MAEFAISSQPLSERILSNARRFIRWVTSPQVILSLIMLLVMYYMVIVPLYRMLSTTVTFQEKDIQFVKDRVVGELTTFHWMRMLASKISTIMTYQPLLHSLTVSMGATLLSFTIGGLMAWLVIRTDIPGRNIINMLATVPYIMPSWTIAMAWTVLFKNRTSGGTPGLFEFIVGQAPPNWLAYGPFPIIMSSALHYYTFFFLFVSAALRIVN